MEGDYVKLPMFHGNETKDTEQYWVLCKSFWTVKKAEDGDFKKGHLATTLRGRALDCFMKFTQVPMGNTLKNLANIRK